MRTILAIGALMLGLVGLLLCAMAVGLGWWAAMRSIDRIDRVAARLDQGLSDVDARLARVESRFDAVRSDLNEVRGAIERIAAENPKLPRVQAEAERLLDRLVPAFDRADAIATSLASGAAGLRAAADIVDQMNDRLEATVRVRNAADKIDGAAESLNGLRVRIEAARLVKAAELTRELVSLAREAAAGSERLADGLTAVRNEIAEVRAQSVEWRNQIVFWIYFAATANAFVWLWGGLGQVCLIGWGRRQLQREPLSRVVFEPQERIRRLTPHLHCLACPSRSPSASIVVLDGADADRRAERKQGRAHRAAQNHVEDLVRFRRLARADEHRQRRDMSEQRERGRRMRPLRGHRRSTGWSRRRAYWLTRVVGWVKSMFTGCPPTKEMFFICSTLRVPSFHSARTV